MSLALNTKHLSSFIKEEEYKAIYPQVEAAHKTLEAKNGPGSDFLGWMYLPRDYDKEEFARIKAAAAKIREDSDVLVVAGIGGSYLGARAVIEAVKAKGLTDRVEYIAFDYTTCKRIVNALPGAMVQYLNGDLAPAAVRQDGIGGIDYRFSAYSGNPGWVKEAHANGMVTNVWTVDTVQDMMTCIAWGMDFITTNNPETLKELLTRTFVSAN